MATGKMEPKKTGRKVGKRLRRRNGFGFIGDADFDLTKAPVGELQVTAGPKKETRMLSQTVKFTQEQIDVLYEKNKSFREAMDSNRYIFYGGYIVLKSKEAFEFREGRLELKSHIPGFRTKYCLRMGRVHEITVSPIEITGEISSVGLIHASYNAYHASEYASMTETDIKGFNDFLYQGANGGNIFFPPETFGTVLSKFIELRGYTNEKLSELTGISDGSIRRYRHDKTTPVLEYVIALCVALQVYPPWGERLVLLSGHSLQLHLELHRVYYYFLNTGFEHGNVARCNQFLKHMNLSPLTEL